VHVPRGALLCRAPAPLADRTHCGDLHPGHAEDQIRGGVAAHSSGALPARAVPQQQPPVEHRAARAPHPLQRGGRAAAVCAGEVIGSFQDGRADYLPPTGDRVLDQHVGKLILAVSHFYFSSYCRV